MRFAEPSQLWLPTCLISWQVSKPSLEQQAAIIPTSTCTAAGAWCERAPSRAERDMQATDVQNQRGRFSSCAISWSDSSLFCLSKAEAKQPTVRVRNCMISTSMLGGSFSSQSVAGSCCPTLHVVQP